ncbi:MAG: tyrosine-type recombinase/integrase [Desulfobacteraceae bacterium]|nr:tyrosine-type recombinase/integrase [Desulfobacteraceae bacterium]
MNLTDSIVNYRRHLKRRNYSAHTLKNYMNTLKQFVVWLDEPIEEVINKKVLQYIDFLLDKGLKPKTINCHLDSIRGFYNYLCDEEQVKIPNPVRRGYVLRLSRPLPKHLRDEEVMKFFDMIKKLRDRAIFKVMLRCGLRVEEVSNLTFKAIDLKRRRIYVYNGKGGKDRVVYISNDAYLALISYLRVRPPSRAKKLFVVEKGTYRGRPISVRGIQKRMEYYARKAGLKVSCHHLRHTMATQLLNAEMRLVSLQDLLGHDRVKTTQRYSKVSNLTVMRDYFKAMEIILKRMGGGTAMT